MPLTIMGGGGGSGSTPPPAFRINSFTNNKPINEMGVALSSVSFDWSYTNGSPISQSIAPIVGSMATGDRSYNLTGQNIMNDMTFTLTASDGTTTRTQTTVVRFFWPLFVGLVSSDTPIESEILAMEKKIAGATSFLQNYTINDQRCAIAIHNSVPQLSDVKETVFNMSVLSEFNKFTGIPVTTSAGIENYTVYIWKVLQNTSGLPQPLNFIW